MTDAAGRTLTFAEMAKLCGTLPITVNGASIHNIDVTSLGVNVETDREVATEGLLWDFVELLASGDIGIIKAREIAAQLLAGEDVDL